MTSKTYLCFGVFFAMILSACSPWADFSLSDISSRVPIGSSPGSSPDVTPTPFITKWKTSTYSNLTDSNQIQLPLDPQGVYNFNVDWGDGSTSEITSWDDTDKVHTYNYNIDGVNTDARFYEPNSMVKVGDDLFVVDQQLRVIRRVSTLTGITTTFVGVASESAYVDGVREDVRFSSIRGISSDGVSLFVIDNNAIRSIDLTTGQTTTIAGLHSTAGFMNWVGTAARFRNPTDLVYENGFLYIVDSGNYVIRRMNLSIGDVTTFAGVVGSQGITNGVGTSARFDLPFGITSDGNSLYVSDRLTLTIRRIDIATQNVTTFAGSSYQRESQDGIGASARFSSPGKLTVDNGYIYLLDNIVHSIRRIEIATQNVVTLAGGFSSEDVGYIDQSALSARFYSPSGLVVEGDLVYISDTGNNVVRTLDLNSSSVSTYAGRVNEYEVTIVGHYSHFSMGVIDENGELIHYADGLKLIDVTQWGTNKWKSMSYMFLNTGNGFFKSFSAVDQPNLQDVRDMSYMFAGAYYFNHDISTWDVSGVTQCKGFNLSTNGTWLGIPNFTQCDPSNAEL